MKKEVIKHGGLVPQLRFPEFKEEWVEKKLGEIADITSSKRVFLSDYVEKGIPFYRGKEISELKKGNKPSDLLYITEESFNVFKEKYGVPQKNDLLITAVGTIGNTYCIPDNSPFYFKDGNLIWLRNIINYNSIFIEYSLEYNKSEIEKISSGSTQKALTIVKLKVLKNYFPSLPEQTKIADFLTQIDTQINLLADKVAQLQLYKKGVMQKLFSQELRFKDEDGKDYPAWEEKKLGELFVEIKEKVGNTKIETYSISAGKGFISQTEKFGRDISGQQNSNYIVLKYGDLSYNKGNSKKYTYGCVYVNEFEYEIAVPNVFISFRPLQNVNSKFYAKLFENHYLDSYLRRIISSSARMDGLLNVNKNDFFKIEIPYPSLPEQTNIANFLTAIDEQIAGVEQQLEQSRVFKKGLLQGMFV